MTASQLLDQLSSAGVVVTLDGNDLRLDAPKHVLTAEIVQEVREHKPEIVDVLAGRSGELTHAPAVHVSTDCGGLRTGKRLIGCGFPSRITPMPPPEIVAAPISLCPQCHTNRVLAELSVMTGGRCWDCANQ